MVEKEVYIKMLKSCFIGIVFVLCVLVVGCATIPSQTATTTSRPVKYSCASNIQTCSNEFYDAYITPIFSKKYSGAEGYIGFELAIENKGDEDLELDWNRTLFIQHGRTNGGFMFEGVVYRDRNNPKPPDIIFSGSRFSKQILPSNLVYFSRGSSGGWRHKFMGTGACGISLSIKVDGREVREKMLINFILQQ